MVKRYTGGAAGFSMPRVAVTALGSTRVLIEITSLVVLQCNISKWED
jgi:hypothetical protein